MKKVKHTSLPVLGDDERELVVVTVVGDKKILYRGLISQDEHLRMEWAGKPNQTAKMVYEMAGLPHGPTTSRELMVYFHIRHRILRLKMSVKGAKFKGEHLPSKMLNEED